MVAANPRMTFCYVSGAGTDSTGKGRVMWARVKGGRALIQVVVSGYPRPIIETEDINRLAAMA